MNDDIDHSLDNTSKLDASAEELHSIRLSPNGSHLEAEQREPSEMRAGHADHILAANADSATNEAPPADPSSELVTPNPTQSGNVGFRRAAEKVRTFPQSPGVYLMKDASGVVIYVGKAKNLRNRAGSYFQSTAARESRTADWLHEIADIDYLECESEVDALLTENRLIKDVQPRHNKDLKDDKTYPYLMITQHEDFPRVEVTRTPKATGAKLFGPFTSAGQLRGALQVLQRVFKFRTCSLDIEESDPRWQWFRPCLLASIQQCTAPCNLRIDKESYRRDIRRLQTFLEGGSSRLLKQMREEMTAASKAMEFEKAARLRDEKVA